MTEKNNKNTLLWIAIILVSISSCITTIRLNTIEHNTETIATPTPSPVPLSPEAQATIKEVFNSVAIAGEVALIGFAMFIVMAFITMLIYFYRSSREE